ncbi:TIGR01244 family sulfur transferase [Marinomonas posidonica]|uniref:Beta-lactamase hydrolase-family protein n=1 Tax=Marinomonas posidonica (strain CECT 7376 / NCIMB 14433 / IVIA-Po-181) TaxID=491952 RepID=F6CXU9_MARPP|nr:TIGR01244 family sulfur transferase [Marinomonas posidonica]AEF54511.1 Beta-lactamase hydrolase-family protein [Marinomonas posidonica IVIA-Po-181]
MTVPVQLDDHYFVTPQISVEDLAALKAQGFSLIVNNRPDGEAEDQPSAQSLKEAAEAMGFEYAWNPIELPKLAQSHVDLQGNVLSESKKTLAFCRTGTRSSVLWVLLENGKGRNYSDLVAEVSAKGFDLSRCAPSMAPLVKG